MTKTAISPTRAEDYPQWYQQIVKEADLAEISPVRGCMVIKPWGYAIWENIQKHLDKKIKETGHSNIYCPLFIPLSYLQREADHVEGFAKECAVVTHSRLTQNADGQLVPDSPLEEPLIVRPTSETIINEMFSRWVSSHRDLPVKINQWANIVRWEMRTRMFLRTTEFLWQEGHTAHATADEAQQEALMMLEVYRHIVEDIMAMPVVLGEKSESERFPGADNTYCIEAMMQDNKALQAGTSHFLGQNFAKSFKIVFTAENDQQSFAWTTSWGVSTRLIGGLIMTHSDDDGLVVPPRLAPVHIVILPAYHRADVEKINAYVDSVKKQIEAIHYHGHPLQVTVDARDRATGDRAWSWYKKGVPVRIEIGPRELEENKLFVGLRTHAYRERNGMSISEFCSSIVNTLDDMQSQIFKRAIDNREKNSAHISSQELFYDFFANDKSGFAYAYWIEDEAIEQQLKRDLHVTMRCYPFDTKDQTGPCIFSGKSNGRLAIFAKSY